MKRLGTSMLACLMLCASLLLACTTSTIVGDQTGVRMESVSSTLTGVTDTTVSLDATQHLEVRYNITRGVVDIAITDAEGQTVIYSREELDGQGSDTVMLSAGDYTISMTTDGAQGTASVTVV